MLFRSPAAVVIVVKHRACLPVGRLIVGVQARSFSRWVTGVQAQQLSDSGSSTVRASGGNSRRIGAIGWSMYCMHIGTIIVCIGSSTVPATGSGLQAYQREVLSTGIVPQAYRRGVYQFG